MCGIWKKGWVICAAAHSTIRLNGADASCDHLQLVDPVKGWDEGVDPQCSPEDHDHYVGFAHIHLPDATTGKPYLSFSERDCRSSWQMAITWRWFAMAQKSLVKRLNME